MNKQSIKKVAILADPLDLQSAGIYVYLKNLIAGLSDKDGLEYHLIRTATSGEGQHLKNIVLPFKAHLGSVMMRKWFKIPAYLKDKSYDAVVEPAHFGPFNLGQDIKRVTVIHDLTPLFFPQFHPSNSVIAHKLLLPKIIRKSDLLITNSKHTYTDVINRFPAAKEKTKWIYPSLNPQIQYTDDKAVLKKLNLNAPYFLSVGTIEPRKDYSTVLKAFELFKQNNPESKHKLVIIGRIGWKSRSFFDNFKVSPFKQDVVIINDLHSDDLPGLYSHCDLFLMASVYEGFGFPLIEAHNCGAVCICSETSSLKEIGAEFAHFFPTSDPQALYQKIIENLGIKKSGNINPVMNSDFSERFHNKLLELLG